jgi:Domain of unknown function (DUF397)
MDNQWRKSRCSGSQGGNCVEVGKTADTVAVRDTKRRDGGELKFSASTWRKFLASVKR